MYYGTTWCNDYHIGTIRCKQVQQKLTLMHFHAYWNNYVQGTTRVMFMTSMGIQ